MNLLPISTEIIQRHEVDGRPATDEHGQDKLLAALMRAHPERIPADYYNAADDFAKSIDLAYAEIRARKAAGGKGWQPP